MCGEERKAMMEDRQEREPPSPPSTKFRSIKPSNVNGRGNLDILCTICTTFDKEGNTVKRVMMRYDDRNELYKCPICFKVVSERTARYYLNIELPQYIYYDKTDSNKKVEDVLEERDKQERFVIEANNDTAPIDLHKRRVAKVIK